MITFARLAIPTYCLLVVLLGYSLSRAMKTWWLRAAFFLTLLVVTILVKSLVGIAAAAIPTIISIIGFELEMRREKAVASHKESRNAKFAKFPIRRWDCRTPLVVFDTDQYLFNEQSVYEYIVGVSDHEQIRLCECRPVFMERVEQEDLLLSGDEDIQLPATVEHALADLNKAIMQSDPISWEQADIAVDVADLRASALTHRTIPMSTHN